MASSLVIDFKVNDKTKAAFDKLGSRVDGLKPKSSTAKEAIGKLNDLKFTAVNKAIEGVGSKLDGVKRKAGGAFGKIKESIGGISPVKVGVGAAVGGIAAIGKGLSDFADKGDMLNKMSIRTGLSVETLSELGFAAEQSGSSLDTFELAVEKMSKAQGRFATGSDESRKKFDELGLDVSAFEETDPEKMFLKLSDSIANIEDPTKRSAAAMEVFGMSAGPELLPLILTGREGIEDLQQTARDTGNVMSTEGAQGAADFGDKMNEMKNRISGVFNQLIPVLLPAIMLAVDAIGGIATKFQEVVGFLRDTVQPFLAKHLTPVIEDVAVVLKAIGEEAIDKVLIPIWNNLVDNVFPKLVALFNDTIKPAVEKVIGLFGGGGEGDESSLAGIMSVVSAAFEVAGQLIGVAVNLFVDLIVNRIEFAIGIFTGLIDFFESIFKGDFEGALNALKDIAQTVLDLIVGIFEAAWKAIVGVFDAFGVDIETPIKDGFNAVKEFFQGVWDDIETIFDDTWTAIEEALGIAIAAVKTVIETPFGIIKTFFQTTWDGIKLIFETVMGVIKTVIQTQIDGWKNVIETTLGIIKGIVEAVWDGVETAWNLVWSGIKTALGLIWGGLKSAFEFVFGRLTSGAANIWDNVSSVWKGIWEGISGAIETAWEIVDETWKKIKGVLDKAGEVINDPVGTVVGAVGDAATGVVDTGKGIVDALNPFAKGGIVTRPTAALIGEAGPEAVIPLNRLRQGPPVVNIHIDGSVYSDSDLELRIENAFRRLEST